MTDNENSVGDGPRPVPHTDSPVGDGPQSVAHIDSAAPTLRLRGVGRRFGGLLAVQGVDLDVAQGERRAVLGPNGAGKTTLFNLICGDMPASSGTIELYGEDVTRSPARTRVKLGLARTYQQSRHFLGLTVEDSIYLSIVGVEGGRMRPVILGRDAEMRERARRSTVSQIFINGRHVGGSDELAALEQAGELDALLAQPG